MCDDMKRVVDVLKQAVATANWDEVKSAADLREASRWALIRWQLHKELNDALAEVRQ